eukprot:1012586-Rhodomonas_salina.5
MIRISTGQSILHSYTYRMRRSTIGGKLYHGKPPRNLVASYANVSTGHRVAPYAISVPGIA